LLLRVLIRNHLSTTSFYALSLHDALPIYNAMDPATGAEWKTNGFQGTINNPYYALQNGQRYKEDRNRLLGTATLRFDITDWLYRSEEHTSELQSRENLVCRLLLEKKNDSS